MLLKFDIIRDGARIPLLDGNGREVTLTVDTPTKTAAIYAPEVAEFCKNQGNDCRVREVR